MPKKPKQQPRRLITLLRGGFGKLETGVIIATKTTTHTVGKQTITLERHIVQMDNARPEMGCSASVRFVFGQSAIVTEKAA